MFTKADYDKYFDQIARIERKMIYGAYELGCQLEDTSIVRVLQKVGDDEVRHYGYVLKMLRETVDLGSAEIRREVREYYLGTIQLGETPKPAGEKADAYCVNLSERGICMEGSRDFSVGEVWRLKVQLFDKAEAIVRRGKVAWSKEVEPHFYIAGMEFEEGTSGAAGSPNERKGG